MKGLVESSNDGIFLVIKHGGIVQESKNARDGFSPMEITTRSGETIIKHIKRYKKVIALVKHIEWYDREYGDTRYMGWKLLLDDQDGTICTLDIPFESRVGTRFMKLAENIEFAELVEFSAWRGPDEKTAFSVKQNGENVPQKYTRDDPGDCPPPVQGFNKKWNFDAQKEFLHERMTNVVLPKVVAVSGLSAPRETTPAENGNGAGGAVTLDEIKSYLKDYATDKKVTVNDAIETWFGTRSWAEVEKMPSDAVEAAGRKLADEMIPF